jgi:hypothetical protein
MLNGVGVAVIDKLRGAQLDNVRPVFPSPSSRPPPS